MSEMVEKVARAIAEADPEQQGQIDDSEMGDYFWEKYRGHYIVLARAALEAMRDLPEYLDDEGWVLNKDFVRDYPLAINAALREEG